MDKYCLDSSAVVKRYVAEPGSSKVDVIYRKAEAGDAELSMSFWNVGEVLGVLSQRRRRKALTEPEYERSLSLFADETLKLYRLRALTLIPVSTRSLVETWSLIVTDALYEADALQIAFCSEAGRRLVSADGSLLKVASKLRLQVLDVRRD